MRDALQRRLVSLVCIRVISCSILQHLLPQSRHCRSNSSQAARFTQPPPTEAANDSQELVEMMQNLLQANTVSQRLGQGKGKMKIIKMLVSDSEDDCVDEEQVAAVRVARYFSNSTFYAVAKMATNATEVKSKALLGGKPYSNTAEKEILKTHKIVVKRIRSERPSAPENTLSNLETPSINKQEEHYSPNVPYSESSSSEEDDPMFHLSKLELCAKIRGLKRKLRYTTRENSRLRQSLALLQVLPQAVTHFEELVGMADALLKSRVNPTSSSTVPHPTWNTSGNPLTESCTAIQSNGISQVTLPVVKEEPSTVKQFQIENWQISLCNKSKPQKFINDLMQALYTHEYMATHSLTGAKSSSSKDRAAKPAMNQNEVQEIIGVTKQLFTNMDDALIRRMMGQKLNNCTKKQNASKDHTSTVFDNYVFWYVFTKGIILSGCFLFVGSESTII